MQAILDQLTPENIAAIEAAYGTLTLWWDQAVYWTSEQFATLGLIVEDYEF
ncbi:MAG: hypothetical protein AAFZ52_11140 [Bacteroidota bacterium]